MSQPDRPNRGLGIVTASGSPLRQAYLNDDIGKEHTGPSTSGPDENQTPDSARRLLNTPSTTTFSGSIRNEEALHDLERGQSPSLYSTKGYLSWLHSPSQRELLAKDRSDGHEFLQDHLCNGAKDFKQSMFHWPASGVLFLSALSTGLSCLFFLVAVIGPRYGPAIGTNGVLTASTAAFLTSLLAKIIEVSFVTIVIAYIGQSLARRAYSSEVSEGVSFAEISMRHWAVQPGTILSHWQAVRHAAFSRLGVLTLVASITALLYTSAATALVQPQLKFSKAQFQNLQSTVRTSFANPLFMQEQCKTPIPDNLDEIEHRGIACFQLEHASQAYHNYQTWLAQWADFALSGNGTREQNTRLPGWAMLSDNITVAAPWIDEKDFYQKGGWMIHNVTMAMPHPGVVAAATDSANAIMQPSQLDGLGIYSIQASVPSPFVNIVCSMGMSEQDLDPVMDDTAGNSVGGTNTTLDQIFEWGPHYGTTNWPPVFQRALLPDEHNTIVNDTIGITTWGRTALYILGRGGALDQSGAPIPSTTNFALCALRVGLTAACSTTYNASSSGGHLGAHCGDRTDTLRYQATQPNETALYGNKTWSADWVNVGSEWAKSIALNDGSVAGNSSNARIWTQLFLSQSAVDWQGQPQLSSALPSPAEALAVMAGSTLLQSARNAPFVMAPWNYSSNPVESGQRQWFRAAIRAQEYASGGVAGYQQGFLVVLAATAVVSAWVLVYLLRHRYWYLDFVDPVNLFPLALNSPPSVRLRESVCGGMGWGNGEDHFKQLWKLQTEGGHVYMESPEIGEDGEGALSPRLRRKKVVKRSWQMAVKPISDGFERMRSD